MHLLGCALSVSAFCQYIGNQTSLASTQFEAAPCRRGNVDNGYIKQFIGCLNEKSIWKASWRPFESDPAVGI
ncbi:hypothetical protein BDW75DRAFT_205439 [Aspergillus navahoensis]